ncbi:MAG: aminopeptidase N [Pseudomonadales bacterium]
MDSNTEAEVRLSEYQPPDFLVEHVDLTFELGAERTLVHSKLKVRRNPESGSADAPVVLDGASLELLGVAIDGEPLSSNQYVLEPNKLILAVDRDAFELGIRTAIAPQDNRSGEGMFVLQGQIATQCEAQGFRKLSYFFDRPDVLATYTVKLIGDERRYPVLLSNGHLLDSGVNTDGTHWTLWHDPHPKPSYIFAVMAGTWSKLEDEHVTGSGKRVALGIYADADVIDQCAFAMGALKRALQWEEDTFGLEYDLDCYHIVALTDHIGAMENKGLNLFEAHGIVADPRTTTDDDYLLIERILAHEVFHNWTGNRVTCRDWFQLSIKEGLTRFRDQLFAQDMALPAYKRIDQVKALRRNQFPEDVGPAAHPIQPKVYLEIKNFYTATVYEKGAEVVRMLYCLLGREVFIAGVRLYLERNDYRAVTKEEFLAAMEEVSGRDLRLFRNWYDQAGRPLVTAAGRYDAQGQRYELTLSQRNSVGGQQMPFHIPVAVGLVGASGMALPLDDAGATTRVLELTAAESTFSFAGVGEPVVPSLFRGFSAPVSYQSDLGDADLAHLMAWDEDGFSRWDAAQQLGVATIRRLAANWRQGAELVVPEPYVRAFGSALGDAGVDRSLLAETLRVPDEPVLSDGLARIDLDAHMAARAFVSAQLASIHRQELLLGYLHSRADEPYRLEAHDISRRRFGNACLEHLVLLADDDALDLALAQVTTAGNMTDSFEALAYLCQVQCAQREEALDWFYAKWQNFPRVIDKWFLVQALSRTPDAVDRVLRLQSHPAMDLMNAPRSWAFYGSFFRQNRVAFHDLSGRGYDLLVDRLLVVDKYKPGASMRFMPQILQWRRYDPKRQALMKAALERLAGHEGISRGLFENVSRALAA